MTKQIDSVVENGLTRDWWWFDSAHAAEKSEAALAWETLRRTRSYCALWRKFKKEMVSLLQHQEKPTLAGTFQHMHLFQRAREAIGEPYFDYMMKGFDPHLTWLELEEHQRLEARGFIFDYGKALKVNPEYVLPRQMADMRPGLSVGMVELEHDGAGNLNLLREIRGGFALRKVAQANFFQKLRLPTPGHYVFVYFDTRRARDTLLQAFDRAMVEWLGTKAPASGVEVDAGYWEKVVEDAERFAILWNPDDRTPVEFWTPKIRQARVRLKANEQTVIPSEEPAFAVFVASAGHNPATIRAAFHTQLKAAHSKNWHPQCVAFWKTLTIEIEQLPRNPDGTKRVELDERGHPIRQKVVRHLFDRQSICHPQRSQHGALGEKTCGSDWPRMMRSKPD